MAFTRGPFAIIACRGRGPVRLGHGDSDRKGAPEPLDQWAKEGQRRRSYSVISCSFSRVRPMSSKPLSKQ